MPSYLWGESGSGKSTILRIAAGLLKPDTGEVSRVDKVPPQVVFQDAGASLTPWMTVGELVGERLLKTTGRAERHERLPHLRLDVRDVVRDVRGERGAVGGDEQHLAAPLVPGDTELRAQLLLRGGDLTRLMVTLGVSLMLGELANRNGWLTGGADGLRRRRPPSAAATASSAGHSTAEREVHLTSETVVMRVAIVSDIHGNLPALDAVLGALRPYDAIWQLGDIVGYGPQPDEVVARLKAELKGQQIGRAHV